MTVCNHQDIQATSVILVEIVAIIYFRLYFSNDKANIMFFVTSYWEFLIKETRMSSIIQDEVEVCWRRLFSFHKKANIMFFLTSYWKFLIKGNSYELNHSR